QSAGGKGQGGELESAADWRTHCCHRTSFGRDALQTFHSGDRQPDRVAFGEFQWDGLLDVFRDRARFRADAKRTGIELDAGTHAVLHRARSLSRRPVHRRISFAPALLGGLALRQRSPGSGRGSDARPRWPQRPAFRARDERWLATLPLSRREPLIAWAACAHGSECLLATAI